MVKGPIDKLTCEKCSEFDKSAMVGMYCNRYGVSLSMRYGKGIVQPCMPCVKGEIFKSIKKEAAKNIDSSTKIIESNKEEAKKDKTFTSPKINKLGKRLKDIINRPTPKMVDGKEDTFRYRFFSVSFFVKRFLRPWKPLSMDIHTMDGRFPDKKRTVKMLMSALNISKADSIQIFIVKEMTKVDYTHYAGLDQKKE